MKSIQVKCTATLKHISFFAGVFIVSILSGFSQSNLISNGTFESGTSSWNVWGGAILAVSADSHSGTQAARVSNRDASYDAIVYDLTSSLENGETYTLSAWVKITDASTNFRATLAMNVDGNTSYKGYLWTSTPVIGSYAFYTETITLTWTGSLVSANLYFETDAAGGVFSDYIIDDVIFSGKAVIPQDNYVFDGIGFKDIKNQSLIGACVTDGSKDYFNNESAKALVLDNYNTITIQCYPAWGRWDDANMFNYTLTGFNSQVKEMKDKNMVVTAHMLLGWDQYFPDWFKNNDFSPDTLDLLMKSWLDAIIGGNGNDTLVDIWNVVNEAVSWNGNGAYWPLFAPNHNNACEFQRMGYEPDSSGLTGKQFVNSQHPVYIRRAFEYARTLTDKKLELRDASFEFPNNSKYNAFYQLAVHLKKVGAPVDAIGFQTHLDIGRTYDWEAYANNIKRYRDLGYEVNIPEVDIGDVEKKWTEEKADLQKIMYYQLITAAIKGGASDIQTWGFIDDNNTGWRPGEKPFPFTNTFEVKPSYYGIREALTDMSHILFWEMNTTLNDTMPDVMKYNNSGTLVNFDTAVFIEGYKANALKFDGIDDYISTGTLSDSIAGDLTFSCFIKTLSSNPAVIADLSGDGIPGLRIGMNSEGRIYLDADGIGLSADLTGTTTVNDDKWHFIAVRRDSVSYGLYIDGASAAVTVDGTVEKFVKLTVGAQSDGSAFFEGSIDEVKLYDTAIEEASFTRNIVPNRPMTLGSSFAKMVVRLTWSDQTANEDGFLIERKIEDGAWEEYRRVGMNVTVKTDTLSLFNTSYSYRVRAFNHLGNSIPTNTVTILTPWPTGIDEIETGAGENGSFVYPNPAGGLLTLVSSQNASMKIYDSLGRFILEKNNLSGRETIDVSNLSNGLFYIKVKDNHRTSVVKFIKN